MWLVVGGPAAVVVASFVTLAVAIEHRDEVLPDVSRRQVGGVGPAGAAPRRGTSPLTPRCPCDAWPAVLPPSPGPPSWSPGCWRSPSSRSSIRSACTRWAGRPLDLSATAVYSLAFFVFWGATAAACLLTLVLDRSAEELNAEPTTDA